MPVAGILDVLDSYGFVRTSGYLPGPSDVYVSLDQVRATTSARATPSPARSSSSARGDRGNRTSSTRSSGSTRSTAPTPTRSRDRVDFQKLTPLYPQERLRLETEPSNLTTRVIDLVAPIGKGQRGLIVSPPKAGQDDGAAGDRQRDHHEQPRGPPHGRARRRAPRRGHRHAAHGQGRGHRLDLRPSGRGPHHGRRAGHRAGQAARRARSRRGRAARLDHPPRPRLQPRGSGLRPDPLRWRRLQRALPAEAVLRCCPQHRARWLADRSSRRRSSRPAPRWTRSSSRSSRAPGTWSSSSTDASRTSASSRLSTSIVSGTRKEEILLATDELKITWNLRRVLHALDQQQGIELLLSKLRETKSNYEFLLQVQKTTPQARRDPQPTSDLAHQAVRPPAPRSGGPSSCRLEGSAEYRMRHRSVLKVRAPRSAEHSQVMPHRHRFLRGDPNMYRPDQRRRRALRAAAPVAGLLAAGLLVWQGSYAAFSATTDNGSDTWATGSLALTNNGGTGTYAAVHHARSSTPAALEIGPSRLTRSPSASTSRLAARPAGTLKLLPRRRQRHEQRHPGPADPLTIEACR